MECLLVICPVRYKCMFHVPTFLRLPGSALQHAGATLLGHDLIRYTSVPDFVGGVVKLGIYADFTYGTRRKTDIKLSIFNVLIESIFLSSSSGTDRSCSDLMGYPIFCKSVSPHIPVPTNVN